MTALGELIPMAGRIKLFTATDESSLMRLGNQHKIRGAQNYSIQTSSLRVVDRGTNFRVATMEHDRIRGDVIDGEVEVQSRVRRPLYYTDPSLNQRVWM